MSAPTKDPAPAGARPGSGEMFDAIAPRYDLLNRLISLGLDQGWRRKTVAAMKLAAGKTGLDLATGTGDLAIMIARTHPDAAVIATDPSRGMLDVAVQKGRAIGDRIRFMQGDAQAIDLPDASVDAVSMAFGIRNVEDRPRALREMARVTKDGGRIAILELSEPKQGVLSALARFHIHQVVPALGGALSGKSEYGYLQRSIAAFPPPDVFAKVMEEAGLSVLEVSPLTFGVVCLYVATPRRS
ncbi:2-heptaprenyl-1,4-naphthoquinone methyltransferase [Minicystis rosea]|nr:2-heptaprenyl-1,4-naphthoquinone methyltransferase [Minicystis rosea]